MVVFLNQPINVGRANSFVLANGGLLNRNPNSKGPGHEISHKLGSLQDEYGEFSGAFLGSTPKSMHLSRSLNKSQIPWRDYLSEDRKSTRLNSSHVAISYAVFCLKKKK